MAHNFRLAPPGWAESDWPTDESDFPEDVIAPGIILIRNGVRTRFMDQRHNGGIKCILLACGAHSSLRADFTFPCRADNTLA